MFDDLHLNVQLLRRRVPNLTVAARNVGLRSATVSDLCNGKIPLGRAEVRTLVALAELAGCTLDELVVRRTGTEMIETGIKVLDLFAPLVRGGTVGLVARQGTGQMVLLAELIHRVRHKGMATLAWLPTDAECPLREAVGEAEEAGVSLTEMASRIAALGAEREVFVAADRMTVLSGELETLRENLAQAGAYHVTVALVDARGESPDEDVPYGPLETLWRFDLEMSARGLYPAVDPVSSTSTLLEGGYLEATHMAVHQRARRLLRRYRELRALVRIRGVERLPSAEAQAYHRGERLDAFLTQPFYTAASFTGKVGQWVTVEQTIDGVRRIMDGGADDMCPTELSSLGPFPAR